MSCFCAWSVFCLPKMSSLRECLREAEAERDCLEVVLKELEGVRTTDDMLDFPGKCCFLHLTVTMVLVQLYRNKYYTTC